MFIWVFQNFTLCTSYVALVRCYENFLFLYFQDSLTYFSLAPSDVSEIFYLTESGNIHLVKDLSGLRQETTYTFLVQARDNRNVNPKHANATVIIRVLPLQGPPVFNPVTVTIPISQALNVSFYQLTATDLDLRVSFEIK